MSFDYNLSDDESVVITFLNQGTVLLPTVSVKVHGERNSGNVRGMLSWGSAYNLITKNCQTRFNLPMAPAGISAIHGVGGGSVDVLGVTEIKFSPHFADTPLLACEVYVVNKINSTASSARLHPSVRRNLRDFELADPQFDTPGEVDILMGVATCPMLLKEGRHQVVPATSCYAMETVLGWVVSGRAPLENYEIERAPPQTYLCIG